MKVRLFVIVCLLLIPYSVSAISQNWVDKLTDYQEINNDNVFLYYNTAKPQIYTDLALDLDKKIILNDNMKVDLLTDYTVNDLLDCFSFLIEKTADVLALKIPETHIYLYPNKNELFRVTSYSKSFYVVMGQEVHLTPDGVHKIIEFILAYNYPSMERKLLESLAKYFVPSFNGVHQRAQYWLNFQELPPLSTVAVKSSAALTEKDWDALVSFMGYVVENYPKISWSKVRSISDIASILGMSFSNMESNWFKYLQNTFYLKLARNEEALSGTEAQGAVLVENPSTTITNVYLEIYTTPLKSPEITLIDYRNYYLFNKQDSNLIRFKVDIPFFGAEEIWVIAKMTYLDSTGKKGMSLLSLPIKVIGL
ncbi:MAG TPA: hypothetical protein GX522_03305 [Firmicutes bacterium]|nr:hypothetical protein [Bacillota bacterium]